MISYLEYYQLILHKVSFDRILFNKEYNKAMKLLNYEQRTALEMWTQSMGYAHLIAPKKVPSDDAVRRVAGREHLRGSASFTPES